MTTNAQRVFRRQWMIYFCLNIDHMHEALGSYRPMDPRLKLDSNAKSLSLLTRKQN